MKHRAMQLTAAAFCAVMLAPNANAQQATRIKATDLLGSPKVGYKIPANYNSLPSSIFNNRLGDDSVALENLISSLTSGGIITFEGGETYEIASVHLPSNIHIRVPSTTTITVPNSASGMFVIGGREAVRNVSVIGVGGKFKVQLLGDPDPSNQYAFSVKDVKNAIIKNMLVLDVNATKISAITAGFRERDNPDSGPKFVTIQNITGYNISTGYGVIQVQAFKNGYIKNITSNRGGAAVRLETGAAHGGVDTSFYYLENVLLEDLKNSKGNYAMVTSPHDRDSNNVVARGVTGSGSSWAIHAKSGFGSTQVGVMKNTKILGSINMTYGTRGRGNRRRINQWITDSSVNYVAYAFNSKGVERVIGPSIGGVLNDSYAGPAAGIVEFENNYAGLSISGFPSGDNYDGPRPGVLLTKKFIVRDE